MINVLLVDDQALVRGALSAVLNTQPDMAIIGETGGGSAGDAIAALRPDVVLLDIQMSQANGFETIRWIDTHPELTQVRVIVLTTCERDEYVFKALRSGACGFLDKHCDPASLADAIRVAHAGDAVLSPSITSLLVTEFTRHTRDRLRPPSALAGLTTRERETAALLAFGLDNTEIAERLLVSPATVRTHLGRAMTKLALRSRAQLVAFAYESGLARPGWLTSPVAETGGRDGAGRSRGHCGPMRQGRTGWTTSGTSYTTRSAARRS